MQASKLSNGQVKVAATGFLSLFSIVGILFYGLPFFYDFWVKEFGWSRATVTSGNAFAKVAVGLLGFFAGWLIDRFGPRRRRHRRRSGPRSEKRRRRRSRHPALHPRMRPM